MVDGVPIPPQVPIVNLNLCGGVPNFRETMDAVSDETVIEYFIVAEEIEEYNPKLSSYINNSLINTGNEKVAHTRLKEMSRNVKFVIITSKFTPYPNVILRDGVAFSI